MTRDLDRGRSRDAAATVSSADAERACNARRPQAIGGGDMSRHGTPRDLDRGRSRVLAVRGHGAPEDAPALEQQAAGNGRGNGRMQYEHETTAGAAAIAAAGAGEAVAMAVPSAAGVQTVVAGDHDKIGRNDPCWCGSGKKFKKCHGA